MTEPLRYAEVDPDGTVIHVCEAYRADDDPPPLDLADVAADAEAHGRTVVPVPADQTITPGAFRVEGGEFIPVPPDDLAGPTSQ